MKSFAFFALISSVIASEVMVMPDVKSVATVPQNAAGFPQNVAIVPQDPDKKKHLVTFKNENEEGYIAVLRDTDKFVAEKSYAGKTKEGNLLQVKSRSLAYKSGGLENADIEKIVDNLGLAFEERTPRKKLK